METIANYKDLFIIKYNNDFYTLDQSNESIGMTLFTGDNLDSIYTHIENVLKINPTLFQIKIIENEIYLNGIKTIKNMINFIAIENTCTKSQLETIALMSEQYSSSINYYLKEYLNIAENIANNGGIPLLKFALEMMEKQLEFNNEWREKAIKKITNISPVEFNDNTRIMKYMQHGKLLEMNYIEVRHKYKVIMSTLVC